MFLISEGSLPLLPDVQCFEYCCLLCFVQFLRCSMQKSKSGGGRDTGGQGSRPQWGSAYAQQIPHRWWLSPCVIGFSATGHAPWARPAGPKSPTGEMRPQGAVPDPSLSRRMQWIGGGAVGTLGADSPWLPLLLRDSRAKGWTLWFAPGLCWVIRSG